MRYVLYVEATQPLPPELARVLDDELAANPQYRLCRELGQLAAVTVEPVDDDAAAAYLERCRRNGQRLGDVKPLALSTQAGWSAVFAPAERRLGS